MLIAECRGLILRMTEQSEDDCALAKESRFSVSVEGLPTGKVLTARQKAEVSGDQCFACRH